MNPSLMLWAKNSFSQFSEQAQSDLSGILNGACYEMKGEGAGFMSLHFDMPLIAKVKGQGLSYINFS